MNLAQAADLVKIYLGQYGATKVMLENLHRKMIDSVFNLQYQEFFTMNKKLHGYWYAIAQAGQTTYNLPDGIINIDIMKVGGTRYYPQSYPMIQESVDDAPSYKYWYWINGNVVHIYPAVGTDTAVYTTGACTVAGSTVTVTSGTLGTTNSLINKLVLVGAAYYVILSNSTTAFSVDRAPVGTEVTYTIYNAGIEIEGARLPVDLVAESTNNLECNDIDAKTIILKTAVSLAAALPHRQLIDINGLNNEYRNSLRASIGMQQSLVAAPKGVSPLAFRRDKAGQL